MKRRLSAVWIPAVFVFALGALVITASSVDAGPKYPLVRKAIHRTHVIILRAVEAVKKGGQDKADLRRAIVQQRAARWSVNHDKPVEAMFLTLQARALARKAIAANEEEVPKGMETDAAKETKAAEGADQAAADAAVAEADKTTPSEDEILERTSILEWSAILHPQRVRRTGGRNRDSVTKGD